MPARQAVSQTRRSVKLQMNRVSFVDHIIQLQLTVMICLLAKNQQSGNRSGTLFSFSLFLLHFPTTSQFASL